MNRQFSNDKEVQFFEHIWEVLLDHTENVLNMDISSCFLHFCCDLSLLMNAMITYNTSRSKTCKSIIFIIITYAIVFNAFSMNVFTETARKMYQFI